MSIEMRDHDLSPDKQKELEKLSKCLVDHREMTQGEFIEACEEFDQKMEEMQSEIDDLKDDVENEKQRADEAYDEQQTYEKEVDELHDKLKDKLNKAQEVLQERLHDRYDHLTKEEIDCLVAIDNLLAEVLGDL